jgi:hypothetical protein
MKMPICTGTRIFYNEFEKTIDNDLKEFLQRKPIGHADVMTQLIEHAKQIASIYKTRDEEQKLPAGNLPQYIDGFTQLVSYLSEKTRSTTSMLRLLLEILRYIINLNRGWATSGKLSDILLILKKDNAKVGNYYPLIQVTCDAERDFSLLMIKYINVFILGKTFDLNLNAQTLKIKNFMAENIKTTVLVARIDRYEESFSPKIIVNSVPLLFETFKSLSQHPTFQSTRKLEEKIPPVKLLFTKAIDAYISSLSWFNRYGRKRALELKSQIELRKGRNEIEQVISHFIATGKTSIDYSCYGFFHRRSTLLTNRLVEVRDGFLKKR